MRHISPVPIEDEEERKEPILDNSSTKLDHCYCLPDAKALKKRLEATEEQCKTIKKQLSAERKKAFSRKKKKKSLSDTLKRLKSRGELDSQASDHLQQLLSPELVQLVNRMKKQPDRSLTAEYPPELRIFASTLQFYSTKAYQFVRKTFGKALPHVTTIRKWMSNLEGAPGFSETAFQLLEGKVNDAAQKNEKIFVSIMLDEMSLKKQIEYDSKTSSFRGYVDIGSGSSADDSKPATDALVIMAVGINQHFKLPLGYFFTAGKSPLQVILFINHLPLNGVFDATFVYKNPIK